MPEAITRMCLFRVEQVYKPDNPNKTQPYFANITFEDLTVTSAPKGLPLGDITCLEPDACTGIVLRSIHVDDAVVDPKPVTCSKVDSGSSQSDIVPPDVVPAHCTAPQLPAREPDPAHQAGWK